MTPIPEDPSDDGEVVKRLEKEAQEALNRAEQAEKIIKDMEAKMEELRVKAESDLLEKEKALEEQRVKAATDLLEKENGEKGLCW